MKICSDELEQARIDCCVAMFSNLSWLNYKYPSKPEYVNSYFDLENIRYHKHVPEPTGEELEVDIAPGEIKEVPMQVVDTTKMLGYNSSTVDIYLVVTKGEVPAEIPADAFVIHPDEEKEFFTTDIGMPDCHRLFACNKSTTENGELSIMII